MESGPGLTLTRNKGEQDQTHIEDKEQAESALTRNIGEIDSPFKTFKIRSWRVWWRPDEDPDEHQKYLENWQTTND